MNKLKEILEANETSIYRLSKLSGVPKTTLVDICSGKSDIEKCSISTVYNIAEALGLGMQDLLVREESGYTVAPLFTIIGGVNGSGKSSFTGAIRQNDKRLGAVIDVDKMAKEIKQDEIADIKHAKDGKTSKKKAKSQANSQLFAARQAVELSRELINKKKDFTQESTIAGKSIISTIKKAKAHGYKIRLFYIGISSADECIERVKGRVARGGHDISAIDIRRRYEAQAESFARIIPLIDEGFIYDNENGFKECAKILDGKIIKTTRSYPRWLREILQ